VLEAESLAGCIAEGSSTADSGAADPDTDNAAIDRRLALT
jgi:hypothetical protein